MPPRTGNSNTVDSKEDSLLLAGWWQGVELWYNQQDYAAAMDAWSAALWRHCDRQDEQNARGAIRLFQDALDEPCLSQSSSPRACRLWLFLGGCFLDAGRHADARTSLRACIRSCSSDNDNLEEGVPPPLDDDHCQDNVCIRAIQEYMASLQEDPMTAAMHCDLSRQVISLVQASTRLTSRVRHHWSDPYLRPAFAYSSISTQPFYAAAGGGDANANDHHAEDERPAWCRNVLEDADNFELIRQECLDLLHSRRQSSFSNVGAGSHRDGAGSHDGSVVSSGSWKEVVLFGSGEQPQLAPQTCRILSTHIPDAVSLARSGGGEVILSLLEPGTRIDAHCATTNLRLTAHLGIIVPSKTDTNNSGKCRIRVKESWHEWQQGKVLVFDDAFEHQVENDTKELRVVLLLRFWHPNLSVHQRQQALELTLCQKQVDSLRRFNPPLPVAIPGACDRAMERSSCRRCGQFGYASLRLAWSKSSRAFTCCCGSEL